jgi:ribosome-binding protein aMBF1 (putative translation factor)
MDVLGLASSEVVVAKRRKVAADSLTIWQAENPLRLWREKQPPEGWTRSVLARQLEVSHTAVATWENGTRLPMVDTFAKIEKLTGISSIQWMEWHGKKPSEART